MTSERTARAVVEAADLAYDAAIDSGRWSRFLAAAADLCGGDNAYLSYIHHERSTLDYRVLDQHKWEPHALRRYEGMMARDPFMLALRRQPMTVLHCDGVVPPTVKGGSAQYQEVFPALDICYSLAVTLHAEGGISSFLGITRSESRNAFTHKDCALLQQVVPHLRRALLLRRRLETAEVRAMLTGHVADRMPIAVLVVAEDGQVLVKNAAGEALLAKGGALEMIRGRLICCRPRDNARLQEAIHKLLGGPGPPASKIQAVVVSELCGGPDKIVLLDSLELTNAWGPARAVIVLIHDLSQSISAELRGLLQCVFGLPPAQARLADLLASGCTLKQAARELGITEASARIYVKRIFERTDTSRQSDLIRKVTLLSAMMPALVQADQERVPKEPSG